MDIKEQPYTPAPNSRPQRVISWLAAQPPGTQASSRTLAAATGLNTNELDSALRSAMRHGLIRRHEMPGTQNRYLWSLGAFHPDGQDDDPGLPTRLLTRALRGGIVLGADEDEPVRPLGTDEGGTSRDWRNLAPANVLTLVDHAPQLLGALLSARQLIEQDHAALHQGDDEGAVTGEHCLVLQQLDQAARIVCQAP